MVRTDGKPEKRQLPEETVSVFGGTLRKSPGGSHRSERDSGVFFGCALIAGGILLYMNTSGIVPWSLWDYIWPFWPLLLIIAGVKIITGDNRFGLLLADILGIVFLVLVGLFAVYQVRPDLLQGLPQVFLQLFHSMRGVMQR